jgi:hypothetical protein
MAVHVFTPTTMSAVPARGAGQPAAVPSSKQTSVRMSFSDFALLLSLISPAGQR